MDYENKPAMDLPGPDLFSCFCSCLASNCNSKKDKFKKKLTGGKEGIPSQN